MPWVRLDDQFFGHRKVADLSKDAKLLHLAALTHCSAQLTDGLITAGALRIICGTVDVRAKVASELVKADLWEIVDENTHKIHDYLAYNPSANQVKSERAAAAQRQTTYRERHPETARMRRAHNAEHNAVSNAVTPGVSNAVSNAAPNPIPNPIPKSQSESDRSAAAAVTSQEVFNSAREDGGGSSKPLREFDGACQRIAHMAQPKPLDVGALADCLGPHRGRDPAWLVAEAAKARKWAMSSRPPKAFDERFLGNWMDRQARKEQREAAAAATHSNPPHGNQQRVRAAPPEPPPPQPASKFAYWKDPEMDPALRGPPETSSSNGHQPMTGLKATKGASP